MAVDPAGRYSVLQIQGRSSTGDRLLCAIDTIRQDVVAIKQVLLLNTPHPAVLFQYLESELTNHRSLVHPYIASMRDVFLTADGAYLCVVMEWPNMGSLLNHVKSFQELHRDQLMREDKARHFFHQLILALDYMHDMQIAHRNLKLDNLLLKVDPGMLAPDLKVCHLGFSKHAARHMTNTLVCLDQYTAPEMLQGAAHWGPEIDVWCAGVILFVLLTGEYPFEQEPQEATAAAVRSSLARRLERHYRDGLTEDFSVGVRTLLDRMLDPDPVKRCSLEELKLHAWFQGGWAPVGASQEAQLAAMNAAFANNQQLMNAEEHPPACEKSQAEVKALALEALGYLV